MGWQAGKAGGMDQWGSSGQRLSRKGVGTEILRAMHRREEPLTLWHPRQEQAGGWRRGCTYD